MGNEIRNPNIELRKKSEYQRRKSTNSVNLGFISDFDIRISDFFRILTFGFRILGFLMFLRLPPFWLPRLLFWVALAVSLVLILLVILAPMFDNGDAHRVLTLFARDVTVRRCSLAVAVGLIVTGFVFFRAHERRPPTLPPGKRKKTARPPRQTAAGA
jgi:hypothetical protein